MITLHEAIRSVQDELIKSQQEREQKGIPQLFVTEKLTIELSCVFSKTDSADMNGGINILSVFALDAASAKSVSSEKIQKVILELKAIDSNHTDNPKQPQNSSNRSIPPRGNSGIYPHESHS